MSGKELIVAAALGIDFMCRIGLSTKVPPPKSGWVTTSVLGYFGATLAASRILGLDEEKMMNALGIVYSQAAGNVQCVIDGALTKRMQPGFAAKGGVLSTLLAEKGITGAKNVIGGEFDLYRVYFQGLYDPAQLIDDLGKRWEVVNLSFKPYPCCRYTHAAIQGALKIKNEHNVQPEEIDDIMVSVGEAAEVVCYPLEVKQQPRVVVDAQFSIPYTISRALLGGKVAIADFSSEAIRDEATLQVSRKVRPRVVKELTRREIEPAIVEIKTKRGTFLERTDFPKGHPQNPMSWQELVDKFKDCASYAAKPLAKSNIEKVIELVGSLEYLDDACYLTRLLAHS